MNTTFKKILWGIIILVIIFLIALPKIQKSIDTKNESAKGNTAESLPVTGLVIKTSPLVVELKSTGTIMANEEVELKTEASGKVTNVYFKEGSKVEKGKLLLKINDRDLRAQSERLEHKINLAGENEKRAKILLEKGGISQSEYDIAFSELNVLKSELSLIKAQIEKTEVYAPFSGTVGLKNISEGSYASPSVIIASLQDVGKIKIDFSVPEKYASRIKNGTKINFDVDGAGKDFEGEIYAIDPKIDPVTRTVQIRAIADNKSGKIFPGAFANVRLSLDQIADAILIPSEAIIPEMKGHKVFISKQGKAEPSKVELGIRKEKNVQILQGIKEGDTLITTGILQLKPGKQVKFTIVNNP